MANRVSDMNNGLNIPLTHTTTRRGSWRVVWMLCALLGTFLTIWIVTRLVTKIDTVSSIRPEVTTQSVLVHKTGRTTSILSEHLGARQLFFGKPWTFSDLFQLSHRQFALHYSNGELIGVTIDGHLDEDTKNSFIERNFYVQQIGNKTVITNLAVSGVVKGKKRLQLSAVLPNYSGAIITHPEPDSSLRSAIFVNNYGIRSAQNNALETELPNAFATPNSLRTLAYYPVLDASPNALTSSTPKQLTDLFIENDGIVLLGEDTEGLAIYIRVRSEKEIEELALIGQDIINRSTLQETALILEDGTRVSELRARKSSITSDLSADDQISTIHLQNSDGDILRISKSGEIVTIANRDSSLESAMRPTSECRRSLNYFVRPLDIISSIAEPHLYTEMTGSSFDLYFTEIAFGEKNTYYCW